MKMTDHPNNGGGVENAGPKHDGPSRNNTHGMKMTDHSHVTLSGSSFSGPALSGPAISGLAFHALSHRQPN